jgi:hypothetical protein
MMSESSLLMKAEDHSSPLIVAMNDKSRKLCACNTPIEESLSLDGLRILQVETQSHLRVPGNQLYHYVLCEVRRLRKGAALVRKIESQTWV